VKRAGGHRAARSLHLGRLKQTSRLSERPLTTGATRSKLAGKPRTTFVFNGVGSKLPFELFVGQDLAVELPEPVPDRLDDPVVFHTHSEFREQALGAKGGVEVFLRLFEREQVLVAAVCIGLSALCAK
jgi:hypothetical protein